MYIPSFPTYCLYVYIYILTKSEFISSCSRPAVGSNIVQITSATFFVNVFKKMAACSHFGCPKITFHRTSYHFRSIPQFLFCEVFLQNGCRRPFWMSENHFRSHFWPFQIDTQLYFFWIFWQNGWRRPFWMSEFHFRSHFWSCQIDTQLKFFGNFLTKWLTSAILHVRNSLSIAFLAISDRYATLFFWGNFWQNGCRRPFWKFEIPFRSHFLPFQINRPFWISEIHFLSQFWPFQIDTEFFFPAAILDVWKSLWITFLAISDRYATLLF